MEIAKAHSSERVDLYVSGRKLKDLEVFSKSDPKCILYEWKDVDWEVVGETETVVNNLNPDFQTSFTVSYWFEREQRFKFEMVDTDGVELIGEAEVTMGNMMGAVRQTWISNLMKQGRDSG